MSHTAYHKKTNLHGQDIIINSQHTVQSERTSRIMETGPSSLGYLVECALCLEGYKTPRMLPCQHCFCEDCLKQLISKKSKPGGTFECPNCRQEVDIPKEGVAMFPLSFTLNKLQEALEKSGKQKCSPSHHHSPLETSTDNPIAEVGGAFGGLERNILESIFCKKHPKKQMSLYCEDCTEAICNACIVAHKRHAIMDQEEKVGLEKTSILESESKMMTKLQLCQDQGVLTQEKERIRCNTNEVISQVKSRCNDICKQINSAGEEIISQLREEYAEMETRIEAKIEENMALSHKLESCVEKHQELRKIPEVMRIIQGKQKLEPEVKELTKAKISRIEEHIQWRFVPGTIDAKSIKELVGTLQTRNLPQKPVLIHSLSVRENGITHDVVICEDGEVYIATNRGVWVYSADGVYTHTITHNTIADSIAELPGGKLVICCTNDQMVTVINKDGSYVHTITEGQGQPRGMARLHNGALAVSYPDEKCVRVFKDCGERAEVVSVIRRFTLERSKQQPTSRQQEEKEFVNPWYLTAHGENGLIVSDWGDNAVYAFTAREEGEYTCQWMYGDEQGIETGMLTDPLGLASDSQGRVLIADYGNNRVLLLSHDGEMLMELLTEEDGCQLPSEVAVGAGKLAVIDESMIRTYNYV